MSGLRYVMETLQVETKKIYWMSKLAMDWSG